MVKNHSRSRYFSAFVWLAIGLSLLLGALVTALPAAAANDEFKVVVHPSVTNEELSDSDLRRIFLRKKTRWNDGSRIQAVDLPVKSPLRQTFSEEVLGTSAELMRLRWQAELFSGRATPPTVLDSEEEVLKFVSENSGAIGYVTTTVRVPRGVREVNIVTD